MPLFSVHSSEEYRSKDPLLCALQTILHFYILKKDLVKPHF